MNNWRNNSTMVYESWKYTQWQFHVVVDNNAIQNVATSKFPRVITPVKDVAVSTEQNVQIFLLSYTWFVLISSGKRVSEVPLDVEWVAAVRGIVYLWRRLTSWLTTCQAIPALLITGHGPIWKSSTWVIAARIVHKHYLKLPGDGSIIYLIIPNRTTSPIVTYK